MTDNWKERIKCYEEMIKENEDFLKYSQINVQINDKLKKNEDIIKSSKINVQTNDDMSKKNEYFIKFS